MDYEQKYKEALERARKIENREPIDVPDGTSIPVTIFPELKESDDERIRKSLIELFHDTVSNDEIFCDYGLDKTEVLAWLEKQGKETSWKPSKEETDALYGIEDDVRRRSTIQVLEYARSLNTYNQYGKADIDKNIAWLEKQYKKDSQVTLPSFTFDDILALQCCMETVKKVQEDKDLYEKLKDLHGRVYDAYWLEKQGEQKPVDKVEPKFKVGDWVVQGCNILRIRCVGDKCYCYETVGGYVDDMLVSEIDSLYHLWTIKDAKDGDVLAVNSEVFIYAHRKQMYPIVVAHCFVDSAGGFRLDGEFGFLERGNSISPATKEQRDLLFSKMKEEGYEWSAEKKELIKL